MLGVPTVLDRLVQQAIAQVLTPIFDPGFRVRRSGSVRARSAHQAVKVARRAIADGHRRVVDVDLERFFDRVDFYVLMAWVARKVTDRRVLKLIRALEAGVMVDGRAVTGSCITPMTSVSSCAAGEPLTGSSIRSRPWSRAVETQGEPGEVLGLARA